MLATVHERVFVMIQLLFFMLYLCYFPNIIYGNGKIIHFQRISIHSEMKYICKTLVNDAIYIAIASTQVVQFYHFLSIYAIFLLICIKLVKQGFSDAFQYILL